MDQFKHFTKRRDLILGFLGALLVTGIWSASMNEEFEEKMDSFNKPRVIFLNEIVQDEIDDTQTYQYKLVHREGRPAIEIKRVIKL